jgi:pyridine nucleotide-disulfide oxidoreductase family protein
MRHLVLGGGGHAHLAVLKALGRASPTDVAVTLVTPVPRQVYSGMLPGWIAGHYAREQCEIDLQALARAANVRLVQESIVGMDVNRRCVALSSGRHLEYDLLSLDVGSETDTSWLELLGERLLPVRPLGEFLDRWPAVLEAASKRAGFKLVIVGSGAAAVEIALAARHAFQRSGIRGDVELIASEMGMLPGFARSVRGRARRAALRARLGVRKGPAVATEEGLMLPDGALISADCVIAATGGVAPCWLRLGGPTLDERGFVAVDRTQRSVSHSNVFAAGDVCARQDASLDRSGVHAVHTGPVLAANLRATLAGQSLRCYRPRRRSLYLLACGSRRAVASWGGWSAEGKWVWRWKDRIDRGFVNLHSLAGAERSLLGASA